MGVYELNLMPGLVVVATRSIHVNRLLCIRYLISAMVYMVDGTK